MNATIKIEGFYKAENEPLHICSGEIEIIKTGFVKVYLAYVSWRIFNKTGQNIASVSKNYAFGDKQLSNYEVFEVVLEDIKKYRIGRNSVFSSIRLIGY